MFGKGGFSSSTFTGGLDREGLVEHLRGRGGIFLLLVFCVTFDVTVTAHAWQEVKDVLLTPPSCKRNQRQPGQNDGSRICTAGRSDFVPWKSSCQLLGFDSRRTEGRSTFQTLRGSDRALGTSPQHGWIWPVCHQLSCSATVQLGQKTEAAFLGAKRQHNPWGRWSHQSLQTARVDLSLTQQISPPEQNQGCW